MRNQGIDLDKATAENRYIAVDATEFLSKFMVDGLPDPARFSAVVGEVIARAAGASRQENGRAVAFGEMVAILSAEGKSEAAIHVERLWNDLARTYSFALHCAYPIQGFSRQTMADAPLSIGAEQTGVVRDHAGANGRSMTESIAQSVARPDVLDRRIQVLLEER